MVSQCKLVYVWLRAQETEISVVRWTMLGKDFNLLT